MAEKETYALITFKSTHAAMAAQKSMGDIKFKICPVLRMISASCGIALRIDIAEAEKAKNLLTANNIKEDMFDTYRIYYENDCPKFERI